MYNFRILRWRGYGGCSPLRFVKVKKQGEKNEEKEKGGNSYITIICWLLTYIYVYIIVSQNSLFWFAERHLIKFNITRWIMKPRPNTWWNLATGDITCLRVIFKKNIDCAEFMCIRFTIDSDWRRYWASGFTEYKIHSLLNLFTWPGLFRNHANVM